MAPPCRILASAMSDLSTRFLWFVRRIALRRYSTPALRAVFWNTMASEIHSRWGRGTDDFGVVGGVLDLVRPRSVLDVGCGSGRLFPLYLDRGIRDVLGVDISGKALALARRDFPQVPTRRASLESLDLGRRFDLAVASQTLQHVPSDAIGRVVATLAAATDVVFLNERGPGDPPDPTQFHFVHDYVALFRARGFEERERMRYDDGRVNLLLARPGMAIRA